MIRRGSAEYTNRIRTLSVIKTLWLQLNLKQLGTWNHRNFTPPSGQKTRRQIVFIEFQTRLTNFHQHFSILVSQTKVNFSAFPPLIIIYQKGCSMSLLAEYAQNITKIILRQVSGINHLIKMSTYRLACGDSEITRVGWLNQSNT